MSVTDDPNDPRIRKVGPDGMQESYLVLSDEKRAKGFVRPVRRSYVHVGPPGPEHPLRALTPEEEERHNYQGGMEYAAFEPYLTDEQLVETLKDDEDAAPPATGRFWTQAQLAAVGNGCGAVTTMGQAIAETYARDPGFYGSTYCVRCGTHFPVGARGEFVWDGTVQRVGT